MPFGRFYLASAYHDMSSVPSWSRNARVKLSHSTCRDFNNFWLKLSENNIGRNFSPPETVIVLGTDASKHGWGAWFAPDRSNHSLRFY